jgi:hypothetical protein
MRAKVKVKSHLYRDHPERGITPAQIEKCLEKGTVQTDPYLDQFGSFKRMSSATWRARS